MAVTDDIKARVDLVDLVSQYVPELKKSGRNFTARCPFHQERTASFVVFPDRQTWRCFGACAVGGDVFSFVMKADNIDFRQAMRSLAERAGVPIPEARRPDAPRNPIYDVNDAALRFFRDELTADRGALARTYAEGRGLGERAIVTFGIGYAPAAGDELLKRLGALGSSGTSRRTTPQPTSRARSPSILSGLSARSWCRKTVTARPCSSLRTGCRRRWKAWWRLSATRVLPSR